MGRCVPVLIISPRQWVSLRLIYNPKFTSSLPLHNFERSLSTLSLLWETSFSSPSDRHPTPVCNLPLLLPIDCPSTWILCKLTYTKILLLRIQYVFCSFFLSKIDIYIRHVSTISFIMLMEAWYCVESNVRMFSVFVNTSPYVPSKGLPTTVLLWKNRRGKKKSLLIFFSFFQYPLFQELPGYGVLQSLFFVNTFRNSWLCFRATLPEHSESNDIKDMHLGTYDHFIFLSSKVFYCSMSFYQYYYNFILLGLKARFYFIKSYWLSLEKI